MRAHPLLSALFAAGLALSLALPAQAAGKKAASRAGTATGDPEVAGELLLKLKASDALQPLLAKYPLTLVSRFGSRPIFRVKTIGKVAPRDLLAPLALEPQVMIAELNAQHRSPEARANMPWAIGNPDAFAAQWAPRVLRLNVAHRLSTGAGVRVAVLDTGIDASHPLFAGRLMPGFDFVDFDTDPSESASGTGNSHGHGTHVAGLVALAAPGARIMPVRVLDNEGVGNAWVLAEALLWAVDPDGNPATDDGAHVINLSLGSLSRTRIMAAIGAILTCKPSVDDDPIEDRSDPGYAADAARCASGKGAVVVAAAGNSGSQQADEYPASEGAYGLLAVGASHWQQKLADFSNSGSWIELAAPGASVTSSMPGGAFASWSGTSMAAPLVSGVAALLRASDPSLTPSQVVRRLKDTGSTLCGTNIPQVDAAAALTQVPLARFRCP